MSSSPRASGVPASSSKALRGHCRWAGRDYGRARHSTARHGTARRGAARHGRWGGGWGVWWGLSGEGAGMSSTCRATSVAFNDRHTLIPPICHPKSPQRYLRRSPRVTDAATGHGDEQKWRQASCMAHAKHVIFLRSPPAPRDLACQLPVPAVRYRNQCTVQTPSHFSGARGWGRAGRPTRTSAEE
jgi:hypothetical protein